MNPDFPQNEREQLEAKLTAFLLGELPPDEVVTLCKAMDQDPELAALYEKLKLTIGFVREGAAQTSVEAEAQPMKLPEAKREKLLVQFKTIAPREFAKPRRGVMDRIALMAACVVLVGMLAALLLPALSSAKRRSMGMARFDTLGAAPNLKQSERSKSAAKENRSEPIPVARPPAASSMQAGAPLLSQMEVTTLSGRQNSFVAQAGREQPLVAAPPDSGAAPVAIGGIFLPTDKSVANVWAEPTNQASNNRFIGRYAFTDKDFFDKTSTFAAGNSNDSYNPQTSYRMLSQLGVDASHTNSIAENYFDSVADVPQQVLSGDENIGAHADGIIRGPFGTNPVQLANGGVLVDPDLHNLTTVADENVSQQMSVLMNRANQKPTIVLPTTPGFAGGAGFGGGGGGGVPTAGAGSAGQTVSGKLPGQMAPNGYSSFDPTTGLPIAATRSWGNGALQTRTFKVDPNQFYTGLQNAGALSLSGKPPAPNAQLPRLPISTNGSAAHGLRYVTGLDPTAEVQTAAMDFFRSAGANLDANKGESVFFNDRQGTVTIHGTSEDLDKAQAAIDALNQPASNVTIAARFVEVNPNNADYLAAERQLEDAKRWRQILAMKTGEEAVEKDLPKARMVTIMDPATPTQQEASGLMGKIREAFTGKVERTARIDIETEHPDISGLNDKSVVSYDPYFILTEFEVIQSDAVLTKVVRNLKLDNGDPSKTKEAVQQLRSDLDLRTVKNSRSIDIGVRSKKPEDAARIANQLAESYRNYRAAEYVELKNHGIKSLQEQLAEQDKKVQLAQAKVDELTKQYSIPGNSVGHVLQGEDRALPKPVVPPPTPQPEMLTRENAFSTFSLNVSDVSFKLAAASLEKGQMPEPASIRSEEFINAFDYRDPEAPAGVPIAFASERARYPFAHNRELLRFSLKTAAAGRQAGRPLNIVLLLDNSGSMERADRVRIIQEALHVLAGQLNARDTFSIVTFARTARLRVDGIHGDQAGAAAAEIARLTPEGGTNLGDALDLAYETALKHYLANGDNRVVVLTDGAANLGDVNPDALKQKVEAHRKQGVALDCFGIGWEDYNDDLLEVLTRNGDGRYGFINSPEEADTTFVSQIAGALHVAAADVKVQVEFNPKRVISYRQIGYAKHQLTKEQFRDNTVDAAEIAAQEAGNALYTIEINPQGEGSVATVHVRYKVPGTSEYREQAWDVPYTGSARAMDQASPAMRLAATASAFSEWLATSPFADEVSTDALLKYLNGVPQVYGADKRPAKLEWMIRQAKSISGK